MAGQSVWERLRALDYPMPTRAWTAAEVTELRSLADEGLTIAEIASRLGRPYYGIAMRLSRLGIVRGNVGARRLQKQPRGLPKGRTIQLLRLLKSWNGSLRQFCISQGLQITSFVSAVERVDPAFWNEYRRRYGLNPVKCPGCEQDFYPSNARQKTCSSVCGYRRRVDAKYFGGRRMEAVGLREGICQLCLEQKKPLAAHHVFGKAADPENEFLIALCSGCHQLVGITGGRRFLATSQGWERLVSLAELRRYEGREEYAHGNEIAVRIEWLTEADILEIAEADDEEAAEVFGVAR